MIRKQFIQLRRRNGIKIEKIHGTLLPIGAKMMCYGILQIYLPHETAYERSSAHADWSSLSMSMNHFVFPRVYKDDVANWFWNLDKLAFQAQENIRKNAREQCFLNILTSGEKCRC